jgi:carbon-monoxide dehydrogenase medium subunit
METNMTIVHDIEYFKPATVEETLGLLSQYKDGALLAGGTDLVCALQDGSLSPSAVIDIKGLPGLGEIAFDGALLEIGALATFSDLVESEVVNRHFPLVGEMSKQVASTAIRSRATLVGNICSAVPCMDSAPVLCVYEAEIRTLGPQGERSIPVSQWFIDSRQTALGEVEVVKSIVIPLPAPRHGGCFVKLGRYRGEDLAQANVAVLALPDFQYRVSFGSVAPVPLRARRVEERLNGQPLAEPLIRGAQELISQEISPISDIRASKEYRLHMCRVMFERAVKAAVSRLEGGGPVYGTAHI